MIRTYANRDGRFVLTGEDLSALEDAVWVDLLHPTKQDEAEIEAALGIGVPTIEEMSEIELSSRLYTEDAAHFMTASMLSQTDDDMVKVSPITYILQADRLVTVRYAEPRAIDTFVNRCHKAGTYTSDAIMLGLVEGLIERLSDLLERAGHELNTVSSLVFSAPPKDVPRGRPKPKPRDFQSVLEQVGRKGDLLSKVRESLVSLQRLLAFDAASALTRKPGKETEGRIKILTRDVQALNDHTGFLTQKITFLLDATLGMINIQQTAIIKIFSVAAVVFLPPTLIASIYGMNFTYMPELGWTFGYPIAIGLMVLSAIVPYKFFKWRGWL